MSDEKRPANRDVSWQTVVTFGLLLAAIVMIVWIRS